MTPGAVSAPANAATSLGSMARKKDTCDLFMQEVAASFR
jgi:hypothetical protein